MINLLPNEMREEREYGRKNRVLLGYSFAVMTTVILVSVIMIGSLQFIGRDTEQIQQTIVENEADIVRLEREIMDLRDVSTRLQSAGKLYEQSVIFSELIPRIGGILPQGSVINGLSLSDGADGDTLSLSVSLLTADLAPVLQQNLISSDLFEAADIGSITPTNDENSIYTFTATVNVSFAEQTATPQRRSQ